MPNTNYIKLSIDGYEADLSALGNQNIELNFLQNEPENWQTIQSAGTSISLPATKNNDKIFNALWNIDAIDTSPGQQFSNLRKVILSVNNAVVLLGNAILNSATFTDKPEQYNLSLAGGNGDWITDLQNVTLWDCLNTATHAFTVANIENSWKDAGHGGYDSDEFHDYVYAPVRYRQPWQYADPVTGNQIHAAVNIYMLRPSISKYWIIIRAFRLLGYSVKSQFLNTQYFRRQVMPWTWGDFYDINSQLVEGISFKAMGILPPVTHPLNFAPPIGFSEYIFFSGTALSSRPSHDPDNTGWTPWHIAVSSGLPAAIGYVKSLTEITTGPTTLYQNFVLNNTSPPNGYDNFGLYSFDISTGTMTYSFTPPPGLSPYIGASVSINFAMNLICKTICETGSGVHENLYIEYQINSGPLVLELFDELSTTTSGQVKGSLLYPTVHNFTVANLTSGDVIKFRLKYDSSGNTTDHLAIISSGYVNVNPATTGASDWQYDSATQQWANLSNTNGSNTVWQPMFSSFIMTGLVIQLGNTVNFQYYDAFRNYNFLDMLGGLVDEFDLEVSTDPVSMQVTIEPFLGVTIPDFHTDGTTNGTITLDGYYNRVAVNDWTNKQDLNKETTVEIFSNTTRQIDYSMKQDGSDGGQNIFAARYLGIYLNNVIRPKINNTNIDNGIIAGVPGASRYMLPDRFAKGNVQKTNRFFSALMHYNETSWQNIDGGTNPAPQLPTIFPENINDSSASAVTQVFEPKSAFYSGLKSPSVYGAWRWVGDPNSPYAENVAIAFDLPLMFGVSYYSDGANYPVLSYSDQNINGAVVPGLMKTFHLPRMAIMRNGKMLHTNMRLNLNDICNFGQRNCIKIGMGLYAVISINSYKPLTDESCEVSLWKIANIEQVDIDSSYPSNNEVLNSPLVLAQYDLRYGRLLMYATDPPQAG